MWLYLQHCSGIYVLIPFCTWEVQTVIPVCKLRGGRARDQPSSLSAVPVPLNPAQACSFSFILVCFLSSKLSRARWSLALNPERQPNHGLVPLFQSLSLAPCLNLHFCFLFWDPGTPTCLCVHLGIVIFWPSGPLAKPWCLSCLILPWTPCLVIWCPLPRLPPLHYVLFPGIFALKLFQVQLWENMLSVSIRINLSLRLLSTMCLIHLN